jgi:arginine/ornithine N-succinyltransferase beta subunit
VRAHRRLEVAAEPLQASRRDPEVLAGVVRKAGPDRFRAVRTRARVTGGRVRIPVEAARLLGVSAGDAVDVVPFA